MRRSFWIIGHYPCKRLAGGETGGGGGTVTTEPERGVTGPRI